MKDHLNPTPSVTFQRYSFNTRKQKAGESIAAFVADLRRLSEHCNFGTTLDDMLRDQLLCGVQESAAETLSRESLNISESLRDSPGLGDSRTKLKGIASRTVGPKNRKRSGDARHRQPKSNPLSMLTRCLLSLWW